KPLRWWGVGVLPYSERGDLYSEFRLDEPWDSEHNKALIPKMPSTLALPGVETRQPGLTFLRGLVGKPGAKVRPVFVEGQAKGPIEARIPDGAASTFLAV